MTGHTATMRDKRLLLLSSQEIPIFQSALQRHTLPTESKFIVKNVEIRDKYKKWNYDFIVYLLEL